MYGISLISGMVSSTGSPNSLSLLARWGNQLQDYSNPSTVFADVSVTDYSNCGTWMLLVLCGTGLDCQSCLIYTILTMLFTQKKPFPGQNSRGKAITPRTLKFEKRSSHSAGGRALPSQSIDRS